MKKIFSFLFFAFCFSNTFGQGLKTDLVEIELGREFGFFSKSPAVLRAITVSPANAEPKEAILFFVGWPGSLWIPKNFDSRRFLEIAKNSKFHMFRHLDFFSSRDLTFVVVDCPTDQWGGGRSANPTSCGDSFRSSPAHADDIRKLMSYLKNKQSVEKFYVMGHSYGSISSRWLAINLGNEIEGSIHSASITHKIATNTPQLLDFGSSLMRIDMNKAMSPFIFIHNEKDQCMDTQYPSIAQIANDKLITVKGGVAEGDPCGGGHLHSYQGKWPDVLSAIYSWIKTKDLTRDVGN
jgi:hypothetical protein